jgi:hypothetical protein
MKITDEEVARLLRVVSEPLHSRWENKNLNGRSLLDLQKSREKAVKEVDELKKKSRRVNLLMIYIGIPVLCMIVWFVSKSINPQSFLTRFMLSAGSGFVYSTLVINILRRLERKTSIANEVIWQCNEVFEKLHQSVASLNPLRTGNFYHDLITEELVSRRMITLAFRILDAEASFDGCRHSPDATRYDVVHSGNWVEKCQSLFEQAWCTAIDDFDLKLDKSAIFKEATSELTRSNAKYAS